MKYAFKFLFAITVLLYTHANAQQQLNLIPLDDADTSLIPIQNAFNNKLDNVKVVGLGEATHGDKTTFGFNLNMVKYLVAQKGFRILFIEGPNSVLIPLNDFIQNDGTYTLTEIDSLVYKSIPPGAYRDLQTVSLVKWLKDYNVNHPSQKVKLMGMSIDLKSTDALLNEYIKPYDPENARTIAANLKTKNFMDKWNDIFNWQDEHAPLIAGLNDTTKQHLLNDFATAKQTLEFYLDVNYKYDIREKDGGYIIHMHGEKDTVHADNFYVKLRNNPDYRKKGRQNRNVQLSAIRDSLMAVYIVKGTGALKSIVWAHDEHVIKPGVKDPYLLMGDHLNNIFGSRYYTIITTYSQGGSIQAFGEDATIKKAQNPMNGQTVMKILKQKFGFDSGIAFSSELMKLSKYNAFLCTASIDGNFITDMIPWQSFDALAILRTLYPRDPIK